MMLLMHIYNQMIFYHNGESLSQNAEKFYKLPACSFNKIENLLLNDLSASRDARTTVVFRQPGD